MFYLKDILPVGGLAALVAWSGGGVVGYALLLWRIGFDEEERKMLASHARRLLLHTSRITDWEETP
jgi:hypothetical protein